MASAKNSSRSRAAAVLMLPRTLPPFVIGGRWRIYSATAVAPQAVFHLGPIVFLARPVQAPSPDGSEKISLSHDRGRDARAKKSSHKRLLFSAFALENEYRSSIDEYDGGSPFRDSPSHDDCRLRESACKPGFVLNSHSSRLTVADELKQPTRERRGPRHAPLFGLAPGGVYRATRR